MRFWNRLRLRARQDRLQSELTDEIRLHRELLEEEFRRQGMSPDDAAREAARQFGNASVAADLSRDEWSFPRFDALLQDLRFALRLMLRQPLLTAAAALTVAFGVGANTAILSVLRTLLLNPLGMSHTQDVMAVSVRIDKLQMRRAADSGAEFADISGMRDTFSAVAAMEGRAWTYQEGGQASRLLGRAVTPEFFQLFRTAPVLGRFFNREDRESLVLSYDMWQARFGGDPGVLGRVLLLDGLPYRVVGVAPANFRLPADAAAWSPLMLPPDRLRRRGYNMNLAVFAQLRAGVTAAKARDRVNRYVAGLAAAPDGKERAELGYGIELDPFAIYLAGDLRSPLWLLWAAALVVLITGCANVAGLLLTRSAGRRKEIAIRLSVGATRWQILRQLLLESSMLGLLGGLAGLAMAGLAVSLLANLPIPGKQLLALVSLDRRMLLYGLGLAAASALLFGLVPALQLLRESQASAMGRSRRMRFQDFFVTAEVAGAFVLVAMTGLLLRSLWKVEHIDTGFDPRNLTTAYFTKPKNDPGFEARVLEGLRNAPGVQSAALVFPIPFTTGGLTSGFYIRNRQPRPGEPEWHGEAYFITPEYFAAMRIPLLRGRNLSAGDAARAPLVCVVDRKMAEKFFPSEDPIGQEISMYADWARIVGVVASVRADGLEAVDRPVIYYSLPQIPFFPQSAAIVRSATPAGSLIRRAVRNASASAPVFDLRTMEERIGESLGIRRVLAALLAIFGAISLLLAAIGIYGVIAQVVAERTREVGVRLAIGARPAQILAQFMRQGLRAGGIGLALGIAAAVAVRNWVGSLLFQTPPLDAAVLLAAAAGISAVLLAAVWWPALRASRINPQDALRHE